MNKSIESATTIYCIFFSVEMTPRKGGVKVQMKGIFVGAKVMRGPDWDWNNQDGGEGND